MDRSSFSKTEKTITIIKAELSQKGGLEKAFYAIADGFLRKGYEISVLTKTRSCSIDKRMHIHHISSVKWPKSFRLLSFNSEVKRWIKKNPSSIVFSMDRTTCPTHMRAGNGVHAAYLAKSDGIENSFSLSPYHKTILHLEKKGFENKETKTIFVNSSMVKEEILHYYNVDPDKIEVVHNGVEWDAMQVPFAKWEDERKKVAKRFRLDPDCFHFLFVGHGYTRKGLNILLKGLSLLPRKSFFLSVIGEDKHIGLFRSLAAQLGLEKNIAFLGRQRNVIPFYQLADCLVIPSFYDPFANVTVEALAMGLRVISSKSNGGHEVLTKENGHIIDNLFCEEEIAHHLQRAMHYPKTWERSYAIRKHIAYLNQDKQIDFLINQTLCS